MSSEQVGTNPEVREIVRKAISRHEPNGYWRDFFGARPRKVCGCGADWSRTHQTDAVLAVLAERQIHLCRETNVKPSDLDLWFVPLASPGEQG